MCKDTFYLFFCLWKRNFLKYFSNKIYFRNKIHLVGKIYSFLFSSLLFYDIVV